MTIHYKLSSLVLRLMPDDWIRSWSLDYVKARGGAIYYADEAQCDCVLLPMRELRVEFLATGDVPKTIHALRGDTVALSMPNGHAGLNFYFKDVPSKGIRKL